MFRSKFQPEINRHYPDAELPRHLIGKEWGEVNFAHLPEMPLDKSVQGFESVGTSLGAIILPEPAGLVDNVPAADGREALVINVFRDNTVAEPGHYLLVTERALERQGRHRRKAGSEYDGIVRLKDGDALPVGRGSWLPLVGFDVSQIPDDPYLAKVYRGTHTQQGTFHVVHNELIWHDTGRINRSSLIQNLSRLTPEQTAHQGFLPAGRAAMAAAGVEIESIFDRQSVPQDMHAVTGQQASHASQRQS